MSYIFFYGPKNFFLGPVSADHFEFQIEGSDFLAFRNFPQALAEKCNSCSRCDCRRWKDCTKGRLFSCRTHWVILSFKEYQQSAKSCDLPKYGRSENSDPCNGFVHIIITQKKMVAESFSGLQLVEKHAQDPCFLAKKWTFGMIFCTKFKFWPLRRARHRKKSYGAVFVYL